MSLAKITKITGEAVVVAGDDIDTDRIIPARFMKVITFDGLGKFAFYDERWNADGSAKPHPLNTAADAGIAPKILVSGFNFGCGSSREHAPQSLRRAGFEAIVAGSFAEIFFGNATTIGLPCVTAEKAVLAEIAALLETSPAVVLTLDLVALTLTGGGKTFKVAMPESAREALTGGRWDAIADLLEGADAVARTAASLPYITGGATAAGDAGVAR
ncbi:MAG: 3-isopropylmalate dehydratase small subunit [Puniceicoccales bacterium]|jgi:3-isopropylmalate/(R)-2-methylmalate dehydratase small subunit|nr:3-isopropylmalate dehydratase small subunit [Puniceicoccales bacterium]